MLHGLSKKILSVRSVAELSKLIAEAVVNSLGFEKATLCLLDPAEKSRPIIFAQAGFEPEESKKLDLTQLIEWIRAPVLTKAEPLFAEDVDFRTPPAGLHPDVSFETIKSIRMAIDSRSFAAVPILIEGQTQGFLLASTNPPYPKMDSGDVELLSILASEGGVAIENLRLYEALKQSYDELEERVKQRTQELAKANEELIRLNKMKSDFVSAVSHELRTPLTSIKGYTSLVRGGRLGPVTQEQSDRLEKINRHTDYLSNLITELLDIARIESGRVGMVIKPFDLTRLLETVADLLAPQMKEKDLRLEIDLPKNLLPVPGDENHLQRVFVNLLSNAIRFTPEHGALAIRAVSDGKTLTLSVKDTGIGMPAADVQQLFTEFFRADNPINREKKGTGLGLVLVKKIVEAHGGTIRVESIVGKGTTFLFTLPWIPIDQPAMGAV